MFLKLLQKYAVTARPDASTTLSSKRKPGSCSARPELVEGFRALFKLCLVFLLAGAGVAPLRATYFPTPLTAPDDSTNFYRMSKDNSWAAGVLYEEGSGSGGFNGTDQKSTLGNVYGTGESFLAMLRSPRGTVRTELNKDPNNVLLSTAPDLGGMRGMIDITGHVYQKQITLTGGTNVSFVKWIPGFLDLALYVPFVTKRFDGVNLQRRQFSPVDRIDMILDQYTQNMSEFLQRNGGLNAEPWQGSGLGDPTFIMRWNITGINPGSLDETEVIGAIPENDTIRNIRSYIYLGAQVPVSSQRDEDKLFSLALGNNGHWGLPLGAGLEFMFNLPVSLKIGLGIDLLWLVAESRMMRVKTDLTQTSLLLLNKAKVQIKPGLTWRLNWFVDSDHLWRGLGAHAGYEFIMHHNDELKTADAGFSSEIIGTTETAQSWYANLVSVGLKYDLSEQFAGAPMAPIIQGFMKFPFSGKHLVNASSVGFQVIMHF